MRLKSCRYCGGVHEASFECPKKPVKKYKVVRKKSKYNSFMSSAAWQKTREFIKIRDYGVCRVCFEEGKLTYQVQCHHIIPTKELIESEWLDVNNLICLCKEHHEDAEAGVIKRETLFDLVRKNKD